MSKFKLCLIAMLAAAATGWADVSVMFTNNLAKATNPFAENTPGTVTLDFAVDGSGNVTLDASCSESNATIVAEIDKFDGSVGTISYSGAFNTNFSIEVVSVGGTLRLSDDDLGGFGVTGQNQWRIDRTDIESVKVTPSGLAGASVDVKGVDWTSRANGNTIMKVSGPQGSYTNSLPASDGTWDLSGDNLYLNNGKEALFFNASTNFGDGYVLAGLSFDLIEELPDSGIEVTFTNDVPAASGATNNMGQITLEYTVDGSGFVTLDATADNNATGAAYLDALLDGPAGWLSYTGAYGKTFSVVLTGSGGLSLSTWAPGASVTEGGLGVYGGNAWIINANFPETITVSMVSDDLALDMKSLNWGIRQAGTANMVYEYDGVAVTNALGSEDGSLDVSEENMVLEGGDTVVISAYTAGLAVQGLAFEVMAAAPKPGVGVLFSYDSANLNFGNGETMTLDFDIDGSGGVSVDASTSNTNAAQIAAVDAWDSSDVGFITNSALFGKSFSLVGTTDKQSGPSAILLWSNDGGALGVSGQNGGRVDGTLSVTNANLESLIWTLTGDVTLDFDSIKLANNNNNGTTGIKVSDADTEVEYVLAGLGTGGTLDLAGEGFSIVSGQALVFSGTTNYASGTGIGGMSFDISAVQALNYADWAAQYPGLGAMDEDDDNDGLDNLYEFAVGGDPTNGTVAPAYMPTSSLVDVGGGSNVLEYVYSRRNPIPVDMQYYCEIDTQGLTLPSWTNAGYSVVGEADAAAGFKTVTNQTSLVEGMKFIKLVVEQD